MRTVQSFPAVAIRPPLGLNAACHTRVLCLSEGRIDFHVLVSQTCVQPAGSISPRSMKNRLQTASSRLPSGLNATCSMSEHLGRKVVSSFPLAVSQMSIAPSLGDDPEIVVAASFPS